METEFYKSIPVEIRGKLQEYTDKHREIDGLELKDIKELPNISYYFSFKRTIEGFEFWHEHYTNFTFPIWSDELNRFVNP